MVPDIDVAFFMVIWMGKGQGKKRWACDCFPQAITQSLPALHMLWELAYFAVVVVVEHFVCESNSSLEVRRDSRGLNLGQS